VSTWLPTGTTKNGEQIRVRGVDVLEFRDGKVTKRLGGHKAVE
jgi:ketosteroid isomerase-like protein